MEYFSSEHFSFPFHSLRFRVNNIAKLVEESIHLKANNSLVDIKKINRFKQISSRFNQNK